MHWKKRVQAYLVHRKNALDGCRCRGCLLATPPDNDHRTTDFATRWVPMSFFILTIIGRRYKLDRWRAISTNDWGLYVDRFSRNHIWREKRRIFEHPFYRR